MARLPRLSLGGGAQGPLIGLIILCVVFSLSSDFFLSVRNALNILDHGIPISVWNLEQRRGGSRSLPPGAASRRLSSRRARRCRSPRSRTFRAAALPARRSCLENSTTPP